MNDLVCALSDYLNLSPDDKYAILAADSRRERYELITRAVNEFMELSKVAEEAKTAQKDNQEQLYREAALKSRLIISRRSWMTCIRKCLGCAEI